MNINKQHKTIVLGFYHFIFLTLCREENKESNDNFYNQPKHKHNKTKGM